MKLLLTLALVLIASVAAAQTTTVPGQTLTFDVPDTVTLAETQASRYDYALDGTTVTGVLAHKCSGTAAPFVCAAPLPAMTTGGHTVAVRRVALVNGSDVAGPLSAPLSLLMRAIPAALVNLRITG